MNKLSRFSSVLTFSLIASLHATNSGRAQEPTNISTAGTGGLPSPTRKTLRAYILQPNDLVQVTVYQEDDLGGKARLEKDGTIALPLIGKVVIAGQTPDQAARLIRDLLAKDYLVNPHVTLTVVEYAKRRFTVLGQVQRPGTYELAGGQPLTLLEAIATAGGYTRLAAPGRITVQRRVNGQTRIFKLNAGNRNRDQNAEPFEVQADDTITVGERII